MAADSPNLLQNRHNTLDAWGASNSRFQKKSATIVTASMVPLRVFQSRSALTHKARRLRPRRFSHNPRRRCTGAELCTALVDEWEPSGPTEQDAVFSLYNLQNEIKFSW